VVSIDRSSFKLLPEKVSQFFIRPPSCFLHKTAQHHIIEYCVFFYWIPIRHKIFLALNLCTSYIFYRKGAWHNYTMASIVLTLKYVSNLLVFTVNTISATIFLPSSPFNKKCLCHQLFGPISGTHGRKKYF